MRNRYKVPKHQWKKWSEQARNVFNTLYGTAISQQSIYNAAPGATPVPRKEWGVIAWNMAWIAASSV